MAVFLDIESALQTKLGSLSGSTVVHWENGKTHTPVLGTKFWRPTHLPAGSQLATADAVQKHQGIFQVDVFVPTDAGLRALLTDLDTIYTGFNTTLSLTANTTRVDILSVGRGRVVKEDSWLHGFIQIEYMCYSY